MSEEQNNSEPIKVYTESELNELENNQETQENLESQGIYNADDYKDVKNEETETQNESNASTQNESNASTQNETSSTEQSQSQTTQQSKFANEYIEQLNDFVKNNPNISLKEAIEWQNTDIESIGEDMFMEEAIRAEFPDASDEYVNMKMEEFENLFLSDEELQARIEDENDPLTEREFKRLYMESEKLVNQGKKLYEDKKNSFDVDLNNKNSEINEENTKKYHADVDATLADYKEEVIKIGDSEIKFEINEAIGKEISEVMKNPDSLWTRYVDPKDGAVNFDKLKSDMLWIAQKDNITKVISDQMKNLGKEEVMKKDNNIDFTNKQSSSQSNVSSKQALFNAYMKAHGDR